MTRIGCRAHDYGKLPAAELAAVLHAKGYTGAQLAMPRGIAGIAVSVQRTLVMALHSEQRVQRKHRRRRSNHLAVDLHKIKSKQRT